MVDSTKGMSSASFTISEADMQRIVKALNHTYTNEVKNNPGASFGKRDVVDAVSKKQTLDNSQVCELLGLNIMNGLISTVEKVETELFYQELRANHQSVKIVGSK